MKGRGLRVLPRHIGRATPRLHQCPMVMSSTSSNVTTALLCAALWAQASRPVGHNPRLLKDDGQYEGQRRVTVH